MDTFQDQIEPGDHLVGWEGFGDLVFMGQMATVLLVAVILSTVLAYHPSVRRKATTLEEFEQPKVFVMYSIVGAVIALLVRVQPSMALVVFGIGGLLRFRTNVKQAKDTGRVILVTVVGLCCGLEIYVVAVLATVSGWVLIYALEGQSVGRLVVQGLDRDVLGPAALAYTAALEEAGCVILGEERNLDKGFVAFVIRTPRKLDRNAIEARLVGLPEDQRGALAWDTA